MFNLDQSIMGARTDNSAEPPRLKRPLSVIKEHLDEDPTNEEDVRLRNHRRTANKADTDSSSPTHTRIGSDNHLKTNVEKKTRRKAVFAAHSPVFSGCPDKDYDGDQRPYSPVTEPETKQLLNSMMEQSLPCSVMERQLLNSMMEQTLPRAFKEPRHSAPELRDLQKDPATAASHRDRARKELEVEEDLWRLKDTATKLNLKTRRPSYLTWRARYLDKPREGGEGEAEVEVEEGWRDGRLTTERKERINQDLQWIRGELIDLRRQDQSLARQLLGIRHELSNLRLAASCEEHRDLLDDAHDHVQELRELSRFVDFPPEMLPSSSLRHIGVTKMNLNSRRFSAC